MAVCLRLLHYSKLFYNPEAALIPVTSTTLCVSYTFQKRILLNISTKTTDKDFRLPHLSKEKLRSSRLLHNSLNSLQTFRDNLSVCPENATDKFSPKISASNFHCSLRNKTEQRSSLLKTGYLNKSSVILFRYFSHM
jgi:hypothetical protein